MSRESNLNKKINTKQQFQTCNPLQFAGFVLHFGLAWKDNRIGNCILVNLRIMNDYLEDTKIFQFINANLERKTISYLF